MSIFIWNTAPSNIYVGWTPASSVWVGDTQVRPVTPPTPVWERPDIDTYSLTTSVDLSSIFSSSYPSPHGLCVSPDGKYVYIGTNDSGGIKNFYLSNCSLNSYTWVYTYSDRDQTVNVRGTRWLYYKNAYTIYNTSSSNRDKDIFLGSMSIWNDLSTYTETKITTGWTLQDDIQNAEFSPDGRYFYTTVRGSIHQYELTTARDLSSITNSWTFTPANWYDSYNLRFSPTWLKVWISDRGLTNWIVQYTLSTPYMINTINVNTKKQISGLSYYTWWFDVTDSWRIFGVTCFNNNPPTLYQLDPS